MKKIIKLKINFLLKYWNYLNFLRMNGVLIFCQNLSLNAKKDLDISRYLKNLNYKWKVLNKKISKNFLDKTFYLKIKNFNNILIVHNLTDIINLKKKFKEYNILVLGYYIQNIFFYKNDFILKNIDKKNIVDNFKKRILSFYIYKINILQNIKKKFIKLLLLLKKKNGNY